jgi:hypothetical protein
MHDAPRTTAAEHQTLLVEWDQTKAHSVGDVAAN